jgi:hypothetical protein
MCATLLTGEARGDETVQYGEEQRSRRRCRLEDELIAC